MARETPKEHAPGMRRAPLLTATGLLLLPVVYLASFGWFWATPHEFSLAHPEDPRHYLVIFSHDTEVHCLARAMYWPLITTLGGHRCYPDRQQHELLFRATKERAEWKPVLDPVDP